MRAFRLLLLNILAGTRSATFMPVYLWSFRAGFLQVVLLFLVTVLLTFIHDYVSTLPDNEFNLFAISHQALLYLLFFMSLAFIAHINRRTRDIDKLYVLLLSIVPVIWLGTLGLIYLIQDQDWLTQVQSGWTVFAFYICWYLIAVFRLFRRFFYLSLIPAFGWVLLYAAINFAPVILLPPQPAWLSTYVPDYRPVKQNVDIEATYFNQSRLMQEMVSMLDSGKADKTEMFFVGFAGYANEDVFMHEVLSAEQIVKNRFNAYGKTAILINNEQTVGQYPLANRFNLQSTLSAVADKMNTEDDILFLFMSSHGSESHALSTRFPRFRLKSIEPEMLRAFLDSTTIKWKVIVLSACYSGGFINKLSDPYTLIITAASADRNSFGCGHDGEYTFFGEAFFEQGLKQQSTIVDAFEHAEMLIENKEAARTLIHSQPQVWQGEEMPRKLEQFERELQATRQ